MPRYEDGSGKFFEIDWVDDAHTSFTLKYGKIGAFPTESTKKHASRAEAEKAWAKQVAERTKKGYAEAKGPAKKPKPIGGLRGRSNPELEAAIDEDPDDTQALLVYADWLQQQGDPRGEFVTLSMAKGAKAKQATAAHLAAHKEFLVGEADKHTANDDHRNHTPVELEWKHGFIRKIRFDMTGYEGTDDPEKLLRQLLELPTARFLNELEIGMAGNMFDGENQYGGHLKTLAALKIKPPLRVLTIGDFEYPDCCEISWASLGDFSKVWAGYPRLESLFFQGHELKLGEIAAPQLRKLAVHSGNLNRGAVKAIAAATFPMLEELDLWLGDETYGADTKLADVTPILSAPERFPSLRSLGICNFAYADELAAQIGRAKIVKQLRVLDLSKGALTSEGAKALVAAAPQLKHLELLDVSDNTITDDADLKALRRAYGKIVRTGDQRDPEEYGWEAEEGRPRYVAVGE